VSAYVLWGGTRHIIARHTAGTVRRRILEHCQCEDGRDDLWNVSRIVGRRTNREDLAPNKKLGASVPSFLSLSCSESIRTLHRVFCEHRRKVPRKRHVRAHGPAKLSARHRQMHTFLSCQFRSPINKRIPSPRFQDQGHRKLHAVWKHGALVVDDPDVSKCKRLD
jgi:hypothetical protein